MNTPNSYRVEHEDENGTIKIDRFGTDRISAIEYARRWSERRNSLFYVVVVDYTGTDIGHIVYTSGYRLSTEGDIKAA